MFNKETEAKMYSKNEAMLDFKKKIQNEKKNFFFQKLIQVIFFQKVETDHPASLLSIQPIYITSPALPYCGIKVHKNKTECPAYGKQCYKCSKYNHFAKLCKPACTK